MTYCHTGYFNDVDILEKHAPDVVDVNDLYMKCKRI